MSRGRIGGTRIRNGDGDGDGNGEAIRSSSLNIGDAGFEWKKTRVQTDR